MFKRLYYDNYRNKVDLWEVVDGGRVTHVELEPPIKFYVQDKNADSDITDIFGNKVREVQVDSKPELKTYKQAYTNCCETDIDFEVKFLQEYYKGQNLKTDMSLINICTLDIEVFAAKEFPKPCDAKYPINLVTMHFSQSGRIVTLGLKEYTGVSDTVKEYRYCASEKILLETMIEIFRKEKVDIITGWNCKDFDMLYIMRRCEQLDIKKNFSPLNEYKISKKTVEDEVFYDISFQALAILDYLQLYKKYTFESRESYSLQNIGMIEVGEGKKDYEGVINDLSERDWNSFVEYNIQDVLLVVMMEQGNPNAPDKSKRSGLKFIELAVTISYQSLIPFESVFSQMSVLTGYILKFLHDKNMVLPDRVHQSKEKLPGAYVYAKQGIYNYCVSYDVESMYPTQILKFNIGPDTLVKDPIDKSNCYTTPLSEYKTWEMEDGETYRIGGIYYRNDKEGILKQVTSKIFKERKDFKNLMKRAGKEGNLDLESYYNRQQHIRKILINSMYGVLGNQYFHLYNNDCASTITLASQKLIKYLGDTLNDYFKNHFYLDKKYFPVEDLNNKLKNDLLIITDTDSCYLCFDELIQKLKLDFKTDLDFLNWYNAFDEDVVWPLITDILQIYADEYKVEQLINFKREKIIKDIIVQCKKHYATRTIDKEGKTYPEPKLEFTGMDIIKTSTPKFCREQLKDTVKMIFDTKDKELVSKAIRKIKKAFVKQDITDISFPRGVSNYNKWCEPVDYYIKNGMKYTSAVPYHVRASQNYNYMIAKYGMKLLPVNDGSKIRFVYVLPTNILNQNLIAWIGKFPPEFNEYFKVDYDLQFEKGFTNIINGIFEAIGWGEVILVEPKMDSFFE
jgi:DNA polymerase elongation subunit (family B)